MFFSDSASSLSVSRSRTNAASKSSENFSSVLKADASGPSSGFAEVATASKEAVSGYSANAAASRDLAAVTTDSYSRKATAAADALDTAAATLTSFGTAAQAFSVNENVLTTTQLNVTAKLALQAPLDAATAVSDAASESDSLNGEICAK